MRISSDYGRTGLTTRQAAVLRVLRSVGRASRAEDYFGPISHSEDSVHAVERAVTEGRQRRVGGVHSPEA